MKPYEENIFKKCIKRWGINSQISMVIEESLELALSLVHYFRYYGKGNFSNKRKGILNEYVDCQIMLDQLKIVFEFTDEEISELRKEKINHVIELLGKD